MPQQPRTCQDVLREAATRLAETGIETSRLDAEVLLRHVLGVSRAELFLRYPEPLSNDHQQLYENLVARRVSGEPVAYLAGVREFMGLPFKVGPGVLIPRPETELLVEWALGQIAEMPEPVVVDVGTGSGAIAVSIASLAPDPVRIVATDVSPRALGIARGNADAILGPERRGWLRIQAGSLLEPAPNPVDLVLANLPYLTPEQIAGNPRLDAEPRLALDGGGDGLDLVRALIADLPRVLAPGGGVGLELDPAQTGIVEDMLRESFPGRTVRTIGDLAGLARHVVMEPV